MPAKMRAEASDTREITSARDVLEKELPPEESSIAIAMNAVDDWTVVIGSNARHSAEVMEAGKVVEQESNPEGSSAGLTAITTDDVPFPVVNGGRGEHSGASMDICGGKGLQTGLVSGELSSGVINIGPPARAWNPIFVQPELLDRVLGELWDEETSAVDKPSLAALMTVNRCISDSALRFLYETLDPMPEDDAEDDEYSVHRLVHRLIPDNELQANVTSRTSVLLHEYMQDRGATRTRVEKYSYAVKVMKVKRPHDAVWDRKRLSTLFKRYPNCNVFVERVTVGQDTAFTRSHEPGNEDEPAELFYSFDLDTTLGKPAWYALEEEDLAKVWKLSVWNEAPAFLAWLSALPERYQVTGVLSRLERLEIGSHFPTDRLSELGRMAPNLLTMKISSGMIAGTPEQERAYWSRLASQWPKLEALTVRPRVAHRSPLSFTEILDIFKSNLRLATSLEIEVGPLAPNGGVKPDLGLLTRPPAATQVAMPHLLNLTLRLCDVKAFNFTALTCNLVLASLVGRHCDVLARSVVGRGAKHSATVALFAREINEGRKALLEHWSAPSATPGRRQL